MCTPNCALTRFFIDVLTYSGLTVLALGVFVIAFYFIRRFVRGY